MFQSIVQYFYFFVKLFKWLESKACRKYLFIKVHTGRYKENKYLMYAVLRSMLQQVILGVTTS